MHLLALHYYPTLDGINAVPIPSTAGLTSSPCSDPAHCRTHTKIVTIVTISACTWAAVHPNIKVAYSEKLGRAVDIDEPCRLASKRGMLLMMSLLAPEYIFAWVIRQYLVTHKIVKSKGLIYHHGP